MAQEELRSGAVSSQALELADRGEEEPAESARRRRAASRVERPPRRRMGRGSFFPRRARGDKDAEGYQGGPLDMGVAGIRRVQA